MENLDWDDYWEFILASVGGIPGERELEKFEFCATGMVEEIGELCGKIKRIHRGDATYPEQREAILIELGDALWYTFTAAAIAEMDWDELFENGHRLVSAGCSDLLVKPEDRIRYAAICAAKIAGEVGLYAVCVNDAMEQTIDYETSWTGIRDKALCHSLNSLAQALVWVAHEANSSLFEVACMNMEKLIDRRARGKTRGTGDNR